LECAHAVSNSTLSDSSAVDTMQPRAVAHANMLPMAEQGSNAGNLFPPTGSNGCKARRIGHARSTVNLARCSPKRDAGVALLIVTFEWPMLLSHASLLPCASKPRRTSAQYRENAGCTSAKSAETTCNSVAATVFVTRDVSRTDSDFLQAVFAKREEVPGLFAYRCVTAHYLSIRFQATFTCNSLVHPRHSSHRFQRRRSVQSARHVLSPRNTGNRARI
jgi:hypothetical protein